MKQANRLRNETVIHSFVHSCLAFEVM